MPPTGGGWRTQSVNAQKENDLAPDKERYRLPAVVRGLGWVSLFTDAAGDMVYPLIAPFLRSMGAGGTALGALEAISEGLGALVKWRSGAWTDRSRHQKRIVVGGYALAAAVRPLLSIAAAPWQVVAIRSTDRIGKGLRSAPRDAMLAGAIAPEHRARAFGFHHMMDNIGAAIGPIVAFSLAHWFGFTPRRIFAFAAVPGVLALAVLIFGVEAPQAPPPAVLAPAQTTAAPPLPGSLRRYLGSLFVFTLGASADSFLLLHLSKLGLRDELIPIAWLSLNAAKALTNVPGGRLSDRLGHKRTLVMAWTLYAAVYSLFPLMSSVAGAWGLLLVYGAYYGLSEGGEKAIVVELAPPEARGRALGAMHALSGLAIVIANLGFGFLYAMSPRAAFGASAAAAMAGALALLALVPPAPSPRRPG